MNGRRWMVVLVTVALATAACSSDSSDVASTTTVAGGDSPPSSEPARGVTEDTIRIGLTYRNLDELRESGVIDVNHGPRDQHLQALADDLNARGGIHGRMIEVVASPYDLGAEAQQATCIELTEDEEVFAVLGIVGGDGVTCYTEQHETIAVVEGGLTEERLARSVAPFATASASQERSLTAFVEEAAANGLFDDKTVAVHATEATNHALVTDVATPALEAAGVEVVFESLIEVGGTDIGGASEAVALNVESMRDKNVDAVFVVGESLVVATEFESSGYFPTLYLSDWPTASGLALDNDLTVFDGVYTFGGWSATDRFDEETFQQECIPVWDAAHPDDPVVPPNDVPDGEPNHTVGLGGACRVFTIFARAAEAAGPELNNATFLEGVETIGPFSLPGLGDASLGVDKYDAQDDLPLWVYDPERSVDELGYALIEP